MKNRDNLPVACSLTTLEFSEREASLLAQFRARTVETKELQEGYAFQFPGEGKSIELIAELIVAERECCPFLAFELVAEPNLGPVTVRATGPPAQKNS